MRRLFDSKGLFILLILVSLVVIEYYCFVAVKTATRGWSATFRLIAYSTYGLIIIAGWYALLNFRSVGLSSSSVIGEYISPFVVGLFVAKILITVTMLLGDVYRLGKVAYNKINKPQGISIDNRPSTKIPRSEFLSAMALFGGGIALGGFFIGASNKYNYQIRRKKITFKNFPSAFNGLKVVQFSDVHSGSFDSKEGVAKGIKMIMDEQPDLILFTGDLVNNTQEEIIPYKEIFAQLKAPMGVYSVLGNHDYGDYVKWPSKEAQQKNIRQLMQHQADMGWELLINEHRVFEKDGEQIVLIGVENWGNRAGFPKYGDLKKAYEGIPEKNIPFQMLMSHDPSHFDGEVQLEYKNIDLTLSGHTHGMQFGVKLPWMQWSPVQYVYKHWNGLYEFDNQKLYVNPGYGFVGYKGRVGILPEITVFELSNVIL